jgi:hypothetical protein
MLAWLPPAETPGNPGMPRARAIVTVVTRNYLAYARSLMLQAARHEPDADRFVVIADRLPVGRAADVAGQVVYGDELGIPDWRRHAFQYTPFELACALKPWAIDHVLRAGGYGSVAYLDGDMGLYGPLTPAWEPLGAAAVVLTPHRLRPLPDDELLPPESVFLQCGVFNAGFVGVRHDDRGLAFVRWWQKRLARHCVVDLAAGLFVDQKWLDLAPGLMAGVRVLRHAGINAGHWALSADGWESRATGRGSTSDVFVDGDPLVLFHFSGMTPDMPHRYRESQTRVRLEAIPGLPRLVARFHADVEAAGHAISSGWGCRFDRLSDGTRIHPAWREAIRRQHPAFADVVDPFDVAARPDLPARYRSIESSARRWRLDWRLARRGRGMLGPVWDAAERVRAATRAVRDMLRAA